MESMFIYKGMSEEERKKALEVFSTVDLLHFGFKTDIWVINQNEDIYLIYVSCTDGTHAPKDFVESCTFFLNWKGNPILISLADGHMGRVLSYKTHYFKVPDNLIKNREEIIKDIKEAVTAYEVAKNPYIGVIFDF